MQNDEHSRIQGPLNHPPETDWMEFLYEEVPPVRKEELLRHLRECPVCSAQVRSWRSTMGSLDAYGVPIPAVARAQSRPLLRLAVSAAVILALGFLVGRISSAQSREFRQLQASVSRLTQDSRGPTGLDSSNRIVLEAARTATAETLRVLDQYAWAMEQQNARERAATALAIQALENRMKTLRTELETVAVNAESGLQQTHQDMAQLVYFSRNQGNPSRTGSNQKN